LKILLIGDIVGKPGREAIKKIVPEFRKDRDIDFVIANAENIAGGSGLTLATVDDLFNSRIDALTAGDHIWKKKEIYERLDEDARILRPANYPNGCPGKGSTVLKSNKGKKIGIINVAGRIFMKGIDCPFRRAEEEVNRISKDTGIILVDMHAEATSEKIAIGVSCV